MSNNYRTVLDVTEPDIADAERALERLFRLTMNRKVHQRQTAAVGVDVTRGGYAVLRCIHESGGEPTLGTIARECAMDPAAAGRQVNALVADDLVERRSIDGDGRVTVVRLTPTGRKVYRRIQQVRTAYMGE